MPVALGSAVTLDRAGVDAMAALAALPSLPPAQLQFWLWEEVGAGALLATHGPAGPTRVWLYIVPGRSVSDKTGRLSKASLQLLCQDL